MYASPHQFEPLLPQRELDGLQDRARRLAEEAVRLRQALPPATLQALRELLRQMNSYYSNLIEGQSTHPANIERALRQDFASQPRIAKLQRIALAHIEAERELEAWAGSGGHPLSSAFLQQCHAALYRRLGAEDRTTDDGVVVVPGDWRIAPVQVGSHAAPAPDALPAFLARMDEVYEAARPGEPFLIAVAAAHQRGAWVHPFLDGNGRAARLQSHCALWALSGGLWSPSRGLARNRARYYELLAEADMPRRGDLDGRGNLSEAALRRWCEFFLEQCLDQAAFMAQMLDIAAMKRRIEALVIFRRAHDPGIRLEAVLPLHHVFAAGPVTRGEFQQMTGLGERTARTLLSRLLAAGLVASAGHTSPVRFAFPLDALPFLLPNLYPEAATTPPTE